MRTPSKIRILVIPLLLLLSACGETPTPEPAAPLVASPVPTQTPPPTRTTKPTLTPSPTPPPVVTPQVLDSPPTTKPTEVSKIAMPQPTRTTRPTWTPSPTPPSVVTPQVLDSPLLLPYDLIWVEDGGLWRWDTHTNEVHLLAGESDEALILGEVNVRGYEFVDEKRVVVDVEISKGEIDVYQYYLLHLSHKTSENLFTAVSQEYSPPISVSPDGKYLVYSTFEGKSLAERKHWDKYEYDYDVFLLDLNTGKQTKLGTCSHRCEHMASWSTDGKSVIWRGEGGLWVTDMIGDSQLVLEDVVVPGDNAKTYHYYPFEWSPDGQFVMVSKSLYASDGSLYGILDSQTGRFEPVTSHVGLGGDYEHVFWLLDGRVIKFAYYPYETGIEYVGLSLYRIQSGYSPMVIEEQSVLLNVPIRGHLFVMELGQSSDQMITIITADGWGNQLLGQYQINLNSLAVTRKVIMNGPGGVDWFYKCQWSPDKEWLLLGTGFQSSQSHFIASIDGEIIYDISAFTGDSAWGHCWLERP